MPLDRKTVDRTTAEHVRTAIDMLVAGKIDGSRIATHILPLDGIGEAFDLMACGEGLRVVLKP